MLLTVVSLGQVLKSMELVSCTVTLAVQVPVLPLPSVVVTVTATVPTSEQAKLSWLAVVEATLQLSVLPA